MKIVVLAGGTSTERMVSLSTGKMIYKALQASGHEVILLDSYRGIPEFEQGKDYYAMEYDWSQSISAVSEQAPDRQQLATMQGQKARGFFGAGVLPLCEQADIVFIALHGENGEDGKVQAAFDLLGIRYTGTDPMSSAIAMNKAVSKELFAYYGIPTPQGVCHKKGKPCSWDRYPAVVKVVSGGSSVGVYIVTNEQELQAALAEAYEYEEQVLIEEFIKGREFSVGVMDGKALPVIEIAPKQGFYDYKNKYQPGSAVETCPADLPDEISRAMQNSAERVFEALRLKTYARMDIMMLETGQFYVLEANTLPGMTPTSLLPQEAAAMGMNFEQLCNEIIRLSLAKYSKESI